MEKANVSGMAEWGEMESLSAAVQCVYCAGRDRVGENIV